MEWAGCHKWNCPCGKTIALCNHFWQEDIYLWRRAWLVQVVEWHLLFGHCHPNMDEAHCDRRRSKCQSLNNWMLDRLKDLLLWRLRWSSVDEWRSRIWHWFKPLEQSPNLWVQTKTTMQTHCQHRQRPTIHLWREWLWAIFQRHLGSLNWSVSAWAHSNERHDLDAWKRNFCRRRLTLGKRASFGSNHWNLG